MRSHFLTRLATWHARIEDRLDLRQQVAIATAVLCVALVLLLAAVAAIVGRSEAKRAASDTLTEIALTLADRMQSGVAFHVSFANHIAALAPLGAVWSGDDDAIRALLVEMRAPLSRASWIGYASSDGTVRASADGSLEGTSVAVEEWFKGGMLGTTIAQSANDDAPGIDDDGRHAIDIGVPVHNQAGQAIGVLGIHLGAAWTERLRVSTVGGGDGNNGIELIALQRDGAVILGQPELTAGITAEMREDMIAEASGVLPDDGGPITAFAVAQLADGGDENDFWLVIARQESADAFAAANRVTALVVACGLAAAVAGIVGAALIAGRVSYPFRRLAEGAEQVRLGDASNLPRARGSAEAVLLSTTLRALIYRLRAARRVNNEIEERAAAEHIRLNRDIAALRNLTEVDTLTGLVNRRKFLEVGESAVEQYRLHGHSFALLMIDIDHFKRVNDTYGHAAGDEALRLVSAVLAGNQRASDAAARLGGEEFATLLRDSDYRAALDQAERLRRAVEAEPFVVDGAPVTLTVSIGLAVCTLGDQGIADVMQRADIGLYAAKSGGRNRVELAPILPNEMPRRASGG